MQANTLVLACSFGVAPGAAEGARKAANALAKGSPMRSCDSDQSTASVVSMSESGSDRCITCPRSLLCPEDGAVKYPRTGSFSWEQCAS